MEKIDDLAKGTILIIDDETDVRWFISHMFQPEGYQTLTAGSGYEGLKIVQECGHKLDLVLLDLRMPSMGGLEVLQSIRKHQPDLPVIVLTAAHEHQEACEKLGIQAFVKKPYSVDELYNKVATIIEKKAYEKSVALIDPEWEPCAKILVVDDEPEVSELLAITLAEDIVDCKFTVKYALNGEQALKMSLDFEPDIAIIDIKMPHMWGDELVKRFKAGQGHCPKDFVIYTSITDPKDVAAAKKLGHHFLTKPTQIDALIEVLKKVCVRHQLLRRKSK